MQVEESMLFYAGTKN